MVDGPQKSSLIIALKSSVEESNARLNKDIFYDPPVRQIYIILAQASFRGYLSRRIIEKEVLAEKRCKKIERKIRKLGKEYFDSQSPESQRLLNSHGPFKYVINQDDYLRPVKIEVVKRFNNIVYIGEINESRDFEGRGTVFYFSGGIVESYWKNGIKQGHCRTVLPTKIMGEGNTVDDKFEGEVMHYTSEGGHYIASYKAGMRYSCREFVFPSGIKYTGNLLPFEITGKGRIEWPNG